MRLSLAIGLALAALAVALPASGASDPRKCVGGATDPASCAKRNAVYALRRAMTQRASPGAAPGAMTWDAAISCAGADAKHLIWRCSWSQGSATITFRALSNGWHTRVAIG